MGRKNVVTEEYGKALVPIYKKNPKTSLNDYLRLFPNSYNTVWKRDIAEGKKEKITKTPFSRSAVDTYRKTRLIPGFKMQTESRLNRAWTLAFKNFETYEVRPTTCPSCHKVFNMLMPGSEIPPEATRDLLQVWLHCLAIGHTFTIREARWVARIRHALPDQGLNKYENIHTRRIPLLFGLAYEYSSREITSEIIKSPIDTSDIDGQLALLDRGWQWVAFRALNLIPRFTIDRSRINDFPSYQDTPVFTNVVDYATEEALMKWNRHDWYDHKKEVLTLPEFEVTESQEYTFCALLLYLSKAPLWSSLSIEDIKSVFSYLCDLVMNEFKGDGTTFNTLFHYGKLDTSHDIERKHGLVPQDVVSDDVLRLVGYEVMELQSTIDNPYPGLRGYKQKERYRAVIGKSPDEVEATFPKYKSSIPPLRDFMIQNLDPTDTLSLSLLPENIRQWLKDGLTVEHPLYKALSALSDKEKQQ